MTTTANLRARPHPPRKLYVAFERCDRVRNPVDHQTDFVIPDEPGPAHAFRLFSNEVPGEEFYTGLGPEALCGARVHARTAQEFPVRDPDACTECAEIVMGVRKRPRKPPINWPCGAPLLLEDGQVFCSRPRFHRDEHRAPSGETWETGREDEYTPAPDGFV